MLFVITTLQKGSLNPKSQIFAQFEVCPGDRIKRVNGKEGAAEESWPNLLAGG